MSIALTRSSLVFLIWVVSIFVVSQGKHKSITPPPPPPSDFPQSVICNVPYSKCYGRKITCPQQCPWFKPDDPKCKGCFVDCNSKKCEAICRTRKANCNGIGSACYDPRFVGGDGVMFYFHGKTNQHFSLVSDSNLQINARFIGRRPQGRSRDNTWIQALGLMFDSHTFTISANKVAQWDDETLDQFHFTYNGASFSIPQSHLSTWAAPNDTILVERTARSNSITLMLPGILEMSVNVVPVTKEDDRIHKYQIPSDDCFAHLEVQFKFFQLTDKVEGVLGQTYRPGFKSPVKRGVAMPIMGGEDKYQTSSLMSADCNYCIFKVGHKESDVCANKALVLDPEMTLDCTGKSSPGSGFFCRR